MRRLVYALLIASSLAAPLSFSGCSTPGENSSTGPTQPVAAPEPAPQCFDGCALTEKGACQVMANVADWNSVERESIDCDPRCCEAGYADRDMEEQSGPDADGDGIFDDADACPGEAEDIDGFQDRDGCPDPDNDADGILDIDDVCPMEAEDVDGFQDQDGCPDP